MYHVYILESLKDGNLYTGMTSNFERRFKEHNEGKVRSTKHRAPFKLLHLESFNTRSKALKRERELKLPSAGRFKKVLLSKDK